MLVLIEYMPEDIRESHRKARNWGEWPGNGAQRVWMSESDAQEAVAGDPDRYNRVIRTSADGRSAR